MKYRKNTAVEYLLDLVYPNRCPCCDKFIAWNELVCSECAGILVGLEQNGERNTDAEKAFYDKIYVAYAYDGIAVNGIIAMKESRNTNFGKWAGIKLADMLRADGVRADFIVPVPMSAKKFRQRGYNQASVIAAEIGRRTGLAVNERLLRKRAGDAEQHSLNAQERRKNVSAFEIKELNLENKHIILCDDVITTASTSNRCAELLKSKGAEKVFIACAAGTVRKAK